ncbi:MAG: 2OG-Fe(II) oxygenase, partial [Actinomycetota bacterium]|nr:2OG-Fe(II) oxygenase [Actinomycetota bacterium]
PADVSPWRLHADPGAPPDRLIYLLDHEYTERGMSWSRLKGDDALRGGVLRAVADELDLEVVPALADVHEVWDCIEHDWRYQRSRRPPDDDYELTDLIDADVLLHLPSSQSRRDLAFEAEAGEHGLCESTPSVKLEPYQSEFEGYTGNAGNTMDRWYRRGALVLWPRARAFAVRARGNPAGALDELLAAGRSAVSGDSAAPSELRTRATMLVPFWDTVTRPSSDDDDLLVKAMMTADLVDDGDLAATLVNPFRIEALLPTGAVALVGLTRRYGLSWVEAQLNRWLGIASRWPVPGRRSREEWMTTLPALCAAIGRGSTAVTPSSSDETEIGTAQLLLARSWIWLEAALTAAATKERPSERHETLESLGPALAGLLEATAVAEATGLSAAIVSVARGRGAEWLHALISALDNADQLEPDMLADTGLTDLALHCIRHLEATLTQPERGEGDWSIEVPSPWHTCDDCTLLASFLAAPDQPVLEWPLAEPRRRHMHDAIDRFELPVTHTTRRKGSPYTLVLRKGDLVQQDRQTRRRAALDLVTALDLLPDRTP